MNVVEEGTLGPICFVRHTRVHRAELSSLGLSVLLSTLVVIQHFSHIATAFNFLSRKRLESIDLFTKSVSAHFASVISFYQGSLPDSAQLSLSELLQSTKALHLDFYTSPYSFVKTASFQIYEIHLISQPQLIHPSSQHPSITKDAPHNLTSPTHSSGTSTDTFRARTPDTLSSKDRVPVQYVKREDERARLTQPAYLR